MSEILRMQLLTATRELMNETTAISRIDLDFITAVWRKIKTVNAALDALNLHVIQVMEDAARNEPMRPTLPEPKQPDLNSVSNEAY